MGGNPCTNKLGDPLENGGAGSGGGYPTRAMLNTDCYCNKYTPLASEILAAATAGGDGPPPRAYCYCGGRYTPPTLMALCTAAGLTLVQPIHAAAAEMGKSPSATAQVLLLQGGSDPPTATAEEGIPPSTNCQLLLLLLAF